MTGDTIFVSVASYRDRICGKTLESLYTNARNPTNVFVGICQQNDINDIDCIEDGLKDYPQFKNNVRVLRLSHYQAKGPTYARYLCSTLWNGENYYMQIDSHIRFVKNWDILSINMINNILSKTKTTKPVLSYYSKTIEDSENTNLKYVPRICKSFFNDRDMISFLGAEEVPITDMPYETPYVAAGYIFANSSFLNELPFDPYLPNLFVGEEILLSMRFWTHGWDIYSPNINIVFHKYTRKDEPHVWDDNDFNDTEAFTKVKNIVGLSKEPIPKTLNKHIDIYGLGNVRTLEQYYKFANIDIKNKKVNSNFCRKDNKDDGIETFINLIVPRKDYEKFEQTLPKQSCNTSLFPYFKIIIILLIIILVFFIFQNIK
jgi:hypothetical protein